MVGEQIRSGRSHGAPTAPERADDVVVVGRGPIAAAVAAAWGGQVRSVDEVPAENPADVLAGATVVVLVAHPGDLVASAP